MSSLRDFNSTQDLHQGTSGDLGSSSRERYLSTTLFGRYPNSIPAQTELRNTCAIGPRQCLINYSKSQLTPTQEMTYLGAFFNAPEKAVSLPSEKIPTLIWKVKRAMASHSMSASDCLSLLGSLSSCIPMVKWARWHLRAFQLGFLSQWRKDHPDQRILIAPATKSSLWWWTRPSNLLVHCSLGPISWTVLTTDASWLGWGAHYQDQLVQGRWQFNSAEVGSNNLELRAAWMAILHLATFLRAKIHPSPDGQQSGSGLCPESGGNAQQVPLERGNTHSNMGREEYNQPTSRIYSRAREFVSRLSFKNIQRQQRMVAEPEGLPLDMPATPQIDLFSSPLNAKTPLFFSRFPSPRSAGVDALVQPWNFQRGYEFPPTPLILRFLQRLTEKVTVLAVIPY